MSAFLQQYSCKRNPQHWMCCDHADATGSTCCHCGRRIVFPTHGPYVRNGTPDKASDQHADPPARVPGNRDGAGEHPAGYPTRQEIQKAQAVLRAKDDVIEAARMWNRAQNDPEAAAAQTLLARAVLRLDLLEQTS